MLVGTFLASACFPVVCLSNIPVDFDSQVSFCVALCKLVKTAHPQCRPGAAVVCENRPTIQPTVPTLCLLRQIKTPFCVRHLRLIPHFQVSTGNASH